MTHNYYVIRKKSWFHILYVKFLWNLHFYRISVLDKILLASGSIIRYQPSLSWGKFDTSINIIVSRSWATERTSSLWGFWKLIEQNCYWFYSFIPSFELFRTKIICYQNVSTKFWVYSSMWFWFLVLLPLRFRKVGRLWCGGARETYWATCHEGMTHSETKGFLKSSFFKS